MRHPRTLWRTARRGAGQRWPSDHDRGSFAVEFAVGWTIFLLALVVLAVAFTVPYARSNVRHAARESARAASLTHYWEASEAAEATAHRLLAGGVCKPDTVLATTDLSNFVPGGTVTVTVSCSVNILIGASRFVTASSEEVVDRYRGGFPDPGGRESPQPA